MCSSVTSLVCACVSLYSTFSIPLSYLQTLCTNSGGSKYLIEAFNSTCRHPYVIHHLNFTILCCTGWVCQGPAYLWPCSESLQIQLPWGPPNSVHCGSEQTTGSTYTLSTLLTHHHKSLDLSILHPFLSLPFCICMCLCSFNLLWRSGHSYHNSQQIQSRKWFHLMHRCMLANKLCFKALSIFMSTTKFCHCKCGIYAIISSCLTIAEVDLRLSVVNNFFQSKIRKIQLKVEGWVSWGWLMHQKLCVLQLTRSLFHSKGLNFKFLQEGLRTKQQLFWIPLDLKSSLFTPRYKLLKSCKRLKASERFSKKFLLVSHLVCSLWLRH